MKTHLENLALIKSLITELNTFDVDDSLVSITVQNDNILKLLANDFEAHVWLPFEAVSNEEAHIYIHQGKASIKVKSALKFRKETILKEY